jgi:hypothetical protein
VHHLIHTRNLNNAIHKIHLAGTNILKKQYLNVAVSGYPRGIDDYMTTKVNITIGIIVIAALLMPNISFVFASVNEPREPFTDEERESGLYNEEG